MCEERKCFTERLSSTLMFYQNDLAAMVPKVVHVECACCGGVSTCKAKNYRKRVLYHASCLQGKRHKNVFERYARRCHHMDLGQLQKYTFHVASWIAKLPAAQMSQRYGELSAVTLLVKYLEFLKESSQPLCHQLTKLLTKVFARITEDLVDVQWVNLREALVVLPQLPQPSGSSQDADMATAAGRLLTKAIQVWRNATADARPPTWRAWRKRCWRLSTSPRCGRSSGAPWRRCPRRAGWAGMEMAGGMRSC